MSIIAIVVAVAAAAVALVATRPATTSPAIAASGAVATGSVAVAIKDFAFAPVSVTVKAGTTVTWTNFDGDVHTVRSIGADTVHSAALDNGGVFSFTFTAAGTYAYHCSIHPEMLGTVNVTR